MLPWRVLDLGTRPFRDVWAQQLALVEARQRGDGEDTLIVVEHPHVFTLGRSRAARDNVLAPGDVEVVEIERGGDATYHGPGQLVCYPIVALRDDSERDLHRFLRRLEDAVIATCARVAVLGDREPGKTGVWTTSAAGTRKKLCSMGIACRKWVTFHGLALNVTTDLGYFARINPCGFEASVMSSLAVERASESAAEAISVPRVREMLAEELGLALGRAA
jgi:lipoyl(octanoyl) transferase